MMTFLKKHSTGLTVGALAIIGSGATLMSTFAGSPDPNLTAIYASSTGYLTDNIPALLGFVALVILALAGVALAFGGLHWIYKKIRGIFRKA